MRFSLILDGTIPLPVPLPISTVATRGKSAIRPSDRRGTLYVVATPIGNLRDITLRALDVLKDVSVIAAEDTRRTGKLLNHYGIKTRTLSLHAFNEGPRTLQFLQRLGDGESVALVTDAGTPLVSDPGGRLVSAALATGLPVEPIPGASAPLAALTMSGFGGEQFTFLGFPPNRSKDRQKWLRALREERRLLIFFEAPHRIRAFLGDLIDVFGDIDVAVCREITKIHEELIKGPISVVISNLESPKGEFTIVLRPVTTEPPGHPCPPSDTQMHTEFGHIAENFPSRRDAIKHLAAKYGLHPKEVYSQIEKAKPS